MKEGRKNKNKEYFIINATRGLSSGDFSSDTAGGRLNGKGVNKVRKKGMLLKMIAR